MTASVTNAALAGPACTLLVDQASGATLSKNGPCDIRNSPASTFKVPLALMGYDAGLLIDEANPAWPYRDEYRSSQERGKRSVDPTFWMHESIVWYSRVLRKNLGAARFSKYVNAFEYGNRDLSKDGPDGDGLPPAVWISSSLAISPVEQTVFIRKMLSDSLPVSARAHQMTRAIMATFDLPDGWKVHGKTGSGSQQANPALQFGWFVGWAERYNQRVVFARLIKDDMPVDAPGGLRARDSLLADLPQLLATIKSP